MAGSRAAECLVRSLVDIGARQRACYAAKTTHASTRMQRRYEARKMKRTRGWLTCSTIQLAGDVGKSEWT